MSHTEISDHPRNAGTNPFHEGDSLASRVTALEHALAAEKARRHVDQERETLERNRQFSLLLEELTKAIEKLERRDLEIEKGLRAEMTRQNRFIYEEFQNRVARLSSALDEESTAIRKSKVDRADIRNLVSSFLGEFPRRDTAVEALLH